MSGLNEEPRSYRRELVASLVVIMAVVGFASIKRMVRALAPAPTEEQCAALFDRWLDQASRQRDPLVGSEDIAAAREEARTLPSHAANLRDCQRELTASEVECGLRAPDVDELERCVQ